MRLFWLSVIGDLSIGKTVRRKRPEIRYRQISLPDDILNFVQADDPNAGYQRYHRDAGYHRDRFSFGFYSTILATWPL